MDHCGPSEKIPSYLKFIIVSGYPTHTVNHWGGLLFLGSVWITGTAAVQTKRNSVVTGTRSRRTSQVDALEESRGDGINSKSASSIIFMYIDYFKDKSAKITMVFQYL